MPSYQTFDDVVVFRSAAASGGWISGTLQDAVDAAQSVGRPLFIDAGNYTVGNVSVTSQLEMYASPRRATLRLAGSSDHILSVEDAGQVYIHGISFNGRNLAVDPDQPLLRVSGSTANDACFVEQCRFVNTPGTGVAFFGMGGEIRNNFFNNCDTAIFANNSNGLSVRGNELRAYAGNGILVWRDAPAFDGTVVDGNYIRDVDFHAGDTGQTGNGVNVFRADNVVVSNNTIQTCKFSAVRANESSSVIMIGNNCVDLGEVALFFENTNEQSPGSSAASYFQ